MTSELVPSWRIYTYPQNRELSVQTAQAAILSRAESGSVYWEAPSPRRSFIRGAVYDSGAKLIPASQRLGGMNSDMVLTVNPPILSTREQGEAAATRLSGTWLYSGSWMHGFGHFLLETLPALWPLVTGAHEFDGIVAHRFNSRQTFDWQFEIVKLLADLDIIVVDDIPMSVETLVVGDRPYHYQVAISPEAAWVWDRVSDSVDPLDEMRMHSSPVYLSRSKFDAERLRAGIHTGREYVNGREVDEVFAAYGFRVVHPQTMSVIDQIRVARSASILAGQAGSALHLSVFCRPGARVIEVGDARTKTQMVGAQQAISAAKQQQSAHIPFHADEAGCVDLSRLRRTLDLLI